MIIDEALGVLVYMLKRDTVLGPGPAFTAHLGVDYKKVCALCCIGTGANNCLRFLALYSQWPLGGPESDPVCHRRPNSAFKLRFPLP